MNAPDGSTALAPPAEARAISGAGRPAALVAYGALGLPLAMAALPLYVQLPAYYATVLGLPLSTVGLAFFVARLADSLPDPWLGRLVDSLGRAGRLPAAMTLAAALLAGAFAGLWCPPVAGTGLVAWLMVSLVMAYVSHTLLMVAHLAWGARIGGQGACTAAAAWREGLGLAGVMLASVLPPWLLSQAAGSGRMPLAYPLAFVVALAAALALLWRAAPPWTGLRSAQRPRWSTVWRQPTWRALLPAYFLNALSAALPATLVMLFVRDRLGLPDAAGFFLGLYFAAGALGLPAWTWLAGRLGVRRAWRTGMLLAAAVFGWAAMLGPGDAGTFAAVCLLSGLALGADLALPPVLLAACIPAGDQPAGYYGIWTLTGKLALAAAALALPALSGLGYEPGRAHAADASTVWLALAYAGVPCALKLAAAALLPAVDEDWRR